ncbi:bifunctional metallophosphatase/5'-nucleotidase [Paenibacillaceae bacterium WGS1546]|uniref:bifunctional metallophosphatase/5'-nucleotidase n=1 Tax=Cohnella sp. WGS1546 TaxID=3366810 RepID=UPI00372D1CF3
MSAYPMTKPKVTITILHTNDIHSHLEEASRIAGYVAETRRTVDPERLLVVDCGDFLDRARMETEGSQAAVNRALLEAIGYDAASIGNNEGLSYTPDELDGIFAGTNVPIVCANMTLARSGDRPSWMIPSLKVTKSGVRIGLIGLTAPYAEYYKLLGWDVSDPLNALRAEAERLRPEVDALVLLSHLGLPTDEKIAASVPGIDLILGGHTHHLLEVPLVVGAAAISAAGKFGAYVGRLELAFGANNELLGVTGGCRATDGLPTSPDADGLIAAYWKMANEKLGRKVATLRKPLSLRYDRESELPTLLAAAVRRMAGAEIGIVNAGQLLSGLPSGDVTEAIVHEICPSPINPCSLTLRGSRIVRALEESLLPEFQNMEIRGFGFRGRVLGALCVDGLEVTADLGQAPYRKILSVTVNGVPLDENHDYAVATLDMFTFGVGYLSLKEGRELRYYLPEFIRDLLARALNVPDWVEQAGIARWRLIGEA